MVVDQVVSNRLVRFPNQARLFLLGLLTLVLLQLQPGWAATGFDRETITLAPDPNETSFHERFNPLVERLNNAGGGTIELMPGTYVTTEQLYVLSNIRLSGSGRYGDKATVIRLADQAEPFGNKAGILRAKDNRRNTENPFVRNVILEDFVIDGNRDNQRQDVYDAEKKYGLYAEAVDMVVRRVTIHSCMGYGFDPHGGKYDDPSIRLLIEDTHSYNNLKDGYALDRQVDMVFRNNLAEDNDRAGINVVTASEGLLIENSIARNNRGDGIVIQNDSGKIVLRNNEVYGNKRHGFYIRDGWATEIIGNEIKGNAFAGVRILGGTVVTVEKNVIIGNSVDATVGHYEIQVDPYRKQGPEEVSVHDNRIQAKHVGAVFVSGDGTGVTVRDNVFQTLRNGIVATETGATVANNLQMAF